MVISIGSFTTAAIRASSISASSPSFWTFQTVQEKAKDTEKVAGEGDEKLETEGVQRIWRRFPFCQKWLFPNQSKSSNHKREF